MWGYNWVVMKEVLRFAAPMDFAALRTFIGAVSMFGLLLLQKKPLTPPPYWRAAAGLGALQTAGFLACSQFALLINGAGKTSVLIYTMPFWTILLARPILQERIQGVQWLAVLLALLGLGLIMDPWHRQQQPVGDALAIGAGLCWAGGTIIAKRLQQRRQDIDLLRLNAWQMALGTLPLLLLAPLVPGRPLALEPYFIVALLYTGILGTALGWLMWLYILHSLSVLFTGPFFLQRQIQLSNERCKWCTYLMRHIADKHLL